MGQDGAAADQAAVAGAAGVPRGQGVVAAPAAEAPAEVGDMNAEEMISHIHDDAVLAAIRAAESRSSGEIRVFITNRGVDNPTAAAWAAFAQLKLQNTAQRNAALVFIAPSARKFAIVGDEGLHRHCAAGFWNQLADELAGGFRTEDYTGALIRVIEQIGEVLARHFPPQRDDRNELPDEIVRE